MDINSLISKIVASLIVTTFVLLIYFSLDIYLVLTRRDFGNVNIQIMHFTRNDFKPIGDALLFRVLGFKIPLRDVYRNRVLFWRMMYASLGAKVEQPVLDFGKYVDALLIPLRGRVLMMSASMELKRASGLPFRETKYQMCVVYDLSEDRRNYVLRVVLVRDEDLKNFQTYLDNPPKAESNFDLLKKVAAAHKHQVGSFLQVKIVTA